MNTCDVCESKVQKGLITEVDGSNVFVCSPNCQRKYMESKPYNGMPLQSWSRIVGYLQSIDGWNPAKREELKERHRDNHYFPENRSDELCKPE